MACLVRDVRVLNPQRLIGVLSSENGMQTSRPVAEVGSTKLTRGHHPCVSRVFNPRAHGSAGELYMNLNHMKRWF